MNAVPAYQPPADDSGIRAISIAGICLGAAALMINLAMILLAVVMTAAAQNQNRSVGNFAPSGDLLLKLAFILSAVCLVTASIGCLMKKEWARKTLLAYAVIYPLLLVIDLIRTATAIGPIISKTYGPNGTVHTTTMNSSGTELMVIVPTAIIDIFLTILPVVILMHLRKPEVEALFKT